MGATSSDAQAITLKGTFELSKTLFADMRVNNGSTVVSSAGGAEYALEGDKWKNGVFTFSLLQALQSNNADLNKDGVLMLSELQSFLFKNVYHLTEGKQNPTSRIENLRYDFPIN